MFSGEVVSADPNYGVGGAPGLEVRAFNLLHRLTRGKRSQSFERVTDHQLVDQIAAKHGLTAAYDGIDVRHRRVYQHNQTDLEFLRTRAARLNAQIWCEDKTLFFSSRRLGGAGGAPGPPSKKLTVGDAKGSVGTFRARIWPDTNSDAGSGHISGEAIVQGQPDLKPDMVVTLAGTDARFDGDYYIEGVTHRVSSGGSGSAGFTTTLRVVRRTEP